jgi:hypothetical protein
VKAYGPDGTLLFTLNFQKIDAGRTMLTLPALPAGARLNVQANVRGIDGRRTDVVELTDDLRGAPKLLAEITAPEAVLVNSPTIISGIVSETTGDIGLRADVVLLVNGEEVDRASNIWIDAGDAVSFAFVYSFEDAGEHDLQAVVEPIPDPSYPTPDDATASTTIIATDGTVAGSWTVVAQDRWFTHAWGNAYSWTDGDQHKTYSDTTAQTWREQRVTVNGTAIRALSFPISLDLELRSGGVLRHEEHWPAVEGVVNEDGYNCLSREIVEQGSALLICSSPAGGPASTSYSYRRFGSTITYHSSGFSDYFDGVRRDSTTWSNSYTVMGGGGQPWTWGSDLSFSLVLGDQDGNVVIHPTVQIRPFYEDLWDAPYACVSHPWSSRDWVTITECSWSHDSATGVRGSAGGIG